MLTFQQSVPEPAGGIPKVSEAVGFAGIPKDPAIFSQESTEQNLPPQVDKAANTDSHVPGFSISQVDWAAMVEQIRNGDPRGMERLYALFSKGIRFFLCRHVGAQDIDDKVHDTLVIVVEAIRNGELRHPDRLMSYVRTVVRRQVANHITEAIETRNGKIDLESGEGLADLRSNPESNLITDQRLELMKEVMREISHRDREILRRFYLEEQPLDVICKELNINETQFRLLKWRAKQKFGQLGRQKLKNMVRAENLLRKILRRGH